MQSGMYSRRSTPGRTAREPSSTRSNAASRGIQERETQLWKISEQYGKAKDELKRKSNECKDVKRELKETKEQLRRKERENEILEKRIDQKEKEIKQFKGASGQKTHQRAALEFAQKMDQKRRELEKRNEEVRQLGNQLKRKDGEIARALEKAREKDCLLRQSEDARSKEEKRLTLLIQNLYGELSTKEEDLLCMQDALRQKESKLEEMRTYLGNLREHKQLRTQAEYLETRNNEARRALEDQSALNKKMHDLEKALEGLEKKHNRASRADAMPREQNELKNVRKENQKLQTQVKGLEARNKEATHAMENEKSVLKNELVTKNQHITSLEIGAREMLEKKERDQKMLERLGTENQQLRTQVDSLQAEKHSLLHQYTEAKSAAESFRNRLSKEFGIRLNSNETNMENISVKNRPAKVAEKFAEIESKEWVVAKEVFDDRFDDERTNIKFLLDLFKHVGGTTGVPESLRHEITAFLKETCGGCDVKSLTQLMSCDEFIE
ncbi:PREDICTED: spindle pole body component 110-like [Branchiostoma belcheri]|uniref:Spindle pole body component 110-like n=1 Tax=Branchiostoma belcheri TaxID=7741 RepID=A0A6P4XZE2_BRABE|nr:PREDICTED: spindle pole body component 110-like [Branchiostoma belcheri]